MKNKPLITIIIATYNSERTLERTLISIKKQTISRSKFEILIVDGGSRDKTISLAKSYGCRVIKNPMTEPIHAKYLGFEKARGRYVMGLDHDEVFVNTRSLEERLIVFRADNRVKAIHSSGYITPVHSTPINYYINEFGDPFSFFIYRLTKNFQFFVPTLRKRYEVSHEDDRYILIHIDPTQERVPLMEVLAAGGMADKEYLVKNFKVIVHNKLLFLPNLLTHLLSCCPYIAVMKNDPFYHYSTEDMRTYFKKLQWRIKNNIYFKATTGSAGFLNRERYEGRMETINKYLFIPYGFSIILPCIDALALCISRKNLYYLIHIPLSICTAFFILYHYIRNFLGLIPMLTSYDGSKNVAKKWQ